jgi:transcriptional regulator with XRE-family HTH domain
MADPVPTLFGRIVRRRREAAGLSQEELGQRTNLSRNYVGMVERGETNPTLLVLRDLADALGTTMSSLVVELDAALSE